MRSGVARSLAKATLGWSLLGWPVLGCSMLTAKAQVAQNKPIPVPGAPLPTAVAQPFHDKHYGVRFQVPAGWNFVQKDLQVSTFHLDARTAAPKTEMRGVAAIDFNPYPLSTFSGALFYYSVQRHTNDHECALQAMTGAEANRDSEPIGGLDFLHGHDEHGAMCIESRDEVYTAYRKGSCYRFDLTVNTFCSISSGALEMTIRQYQDIEKKMDGILDSVVLDWHPVPSDAPKSTPNRRLLPAIPPEKPAPVKATQAAL